MNKSIAGYKIFNTDSDYDRMHKLIRYFSYRALLPKFSQFLSSAGVVKEGFESFFSQVVDEADKQIQIIAYCLMPTHLHIVAKDLKEKSIPIFMGNVLNSYARYFNVKHSRQGPLWVGAYKSVPVQSDEQLLHVTRYVHLNPVTEGLVSHPSQWTHSSFMEYINPQSISHRLCTYDGILDLETTDYEQFVVEHIGEQRELAEIKRSNHFYTSKV